MVAVFILEQLMNEVEFAQWLGEKTFYFLLASGILIVFIGYAKRLWRQNDPSNREDNGSK